ncbi:terminase family protein [Lentilitoribacter sp. Alg239-R112]|uniref:DNA-packaging protein n=1 Tax=Lentilitoribacter sp. Alg239-R112 TaxID=2305987 RepID=UPI001FCE68A7|nr:terminase family protein [Lentilitoribacter sp. Alg239-R112]
MLVNDWQLNARTEQLPPQGDWFIWLLLGGRGAGKTRAGSEWVHNIATCQGHVLDGLNCGRIALVAETLSDAREIMVDGDSGILNIAKHDRPLYQSTRRRLVWPNGAIAQIFSSEDPESLRGPQFDAAWCDELCKWQYPQETWDMLQFGLRLGENPRQLVTTTPKPIALLKAIMADKNTAIVKMRTDDNAENLAKNFLANVRSRYGNTRLGRQELNGEILEDQEGTLWTRDRLDELRLTEMPQLMRIVIAVDPPASSKAQGSCCGIVVVGLNSRGHAIVLKDASIEQATPSQWANITAKCYQDFDADLIVAEVNQGGDMVKSVLHASDAQLPIQMVRASRGKWLRAEPVAALYEQGKVWHLDGLDSLEDQMCNFTHQGLLGGGSPDRLDALVWAVTALLLDKSSKPIIRSI